LPVAGSPVNLSQHLVGHLMCARKSDVVIFIKENYCISMEWHLDSVLPAGSALSAKPALHLLRVAHFKNMK
jgi:hypothetical protein